MKDADSVRDPGYKGFQEAIFTDNPNLAQPSASLKSTIPQNKKNVPVVVIYDSDKTSITHHIVNYC